jgi:ribosomal 30S subunit maturation factor RimM
LAWRFSIPKESESRSSRTWATPGGELYVVNGAFKEHLIPAVKEIIEKVDFAAGKMFINPLKGY